MLPVRNLFAAVLASAGALFWGPPTVLAICLRGPAPSVVVTTPSCCRNAPATVPAADGSAPTSCLGCCAKFQIGLGLDGAGPRVDASAGTAPPVPVVLATTASLAPAPPVSRPVPRPPPEKVLPLRI